MPKEKKGNKTKVVPPAVGLQDPSQAGVGGSRTAQQRSRRRLQSNIRGGLGQERAKRKKLGETIKARAGLKGAVRPDRPRRERGKGSVFKDEAFITDEAEIDQATQLTITLPDGTELVYDQLDADPPEEVDDEYISREPKESYPYSRPGWAKLFYAQMERDNRQRYQARIEEAFGKLEAPPDIPNVKLNALWCEAPRCCFESRLIFIDAYTHHEAGPTVEGYKNRGRPPIDHYNGDWVERLTIIKQWVARGEGTRSEEQIRAEVIRRYHSPPLRITHKKCNLSREKH